MVEYIIVSASTLGSWFTDLLPSTDQIPDRWLYGGIAALILIAIIFLKK